MIPDLRRLSLVLSMVHSAWFFRQFWQGGAPEHCSVNGQFFPLVPLTSLQGYILIMEGTFSFRALHAVQATPILVLFLDCWRASSPFLSRRVPRGTGAKGRWTSVIVMMRHVDFPRKEKASERETGSERQYINKNGDMRAKAPRKVTSSPDQRQTRSGSFNN